MANVSGNAVQASGLSQSMEASQSSVSDDLDTTPGLESGDGPPQKKGPGRKKRTEPILVETEDGELKYVTPTEFRKLRRRITNRMSARRMRKKHADEKSQIRTQQISLESELEQCKEENEKLHQSLGQANDVIASLETENRELKMALSKVGAPSMYIEPVQPQHSMQSQQGYSAMGQRNASLTLQSTDVLPSPRHSSDYNISSVQPLYSNNPFLQPSINAQMQSYIPHPQSNPQEMMNFTSLPTFHEQNLQQFQGQRYQQER